MTELNVSLVAIAAITEGNNGSVMYETQQQLNSNRQVDNFIFSSVKHDIKTNGVL